MRRHPSPAARRLAVAVAAAIAAAVLTVSPRLAVAQTYQFRRCDTFPPNCTTVTLTLTPPAPGTPELFPGSGVPWRLSAHTVHDVQQLTVVDPVLGPIYLGPYGYYQLFPQFLSGGPGFFTDGGFDDTPWLFGGPPFDTEGVYVVDDWDWVRPSGGITGLRGESYGAGTVTFTALTPLATPEPGVVALVATGLLGLGLAARRRAG